MSYVLTRAYLFRRECREYICTDKEKYQLEHERPQCPENTLKDLNPRKPTSAPFLFFLLLHVLLLAFSQNLALCTWRRNSHCRHENLILHFLLMSSQCYCPMLSVYRHVPKNGSLALLCCSPGFLWNLLGLIANLPSWAGTQLVQSINGPHDPSSNSWSTWFDSPSAWFMVTL